MDELLKLKSEEAVIKEKQINSVKAEDYFLASELRDKRAILTSKIELLESEKGLLNEAELKIRIKNLIENYKYAKKNNAPNLDLYEQNLNHLNLLLSNIRKNNE